MAIRGKNINLFLMDGTVNGRIKCTLANWTGVVYKIPRTELDKCKERDDLKRSGVYFLFGSSDQTGENVVYIGQAGVRKNGEGILFRLQEHKRNPDKDYWTEAVVFTTSNNFFGPTEISYLENRFCTLATDAKRYIIKNSNDPASGHITEEKGSELEEFIDYAKIIMGTLGHKVFEPLFQQSTPLDASVNVDPNEQIFYINRSGANAKSRLTNEGFVVLAGSIIRGDVVPSCPDYVKAVREDNKENIDKNHVLLKDLLFKTPSGASAFVLGASTNGTVEWKTKNGKRLKDIESEDIDFSLDKVSEK
ncbi:methionine sulfoxide reductase [Clostridia bacterium]|nr:methionine sulfoxide reductase [Clostridia bacterium]